ncbi:B12-binding domain-containing radical SAM protein [Lachnospiraceae bacterium]|nr:B12-binding domain-containing radical SAM protein [Lachnospiraceae bacterium]BDF39615.1 B12-binding domain-containing radical SAM protein [Lachnospiraceae bacterium]
MGRSVRKKMKILLAAINAKYIHSNLAVHSLRAYAQSYYMPQEGGAAPETDIAEYTVNQQPDQILMDIYRRKPDVICFSCYIWNIAYVEDMVRELKKICPDTHIWLGGPEVSYDTPDVLRRLPEVSGVMRGEGEETFTELCCIYCTKGLSGAADEFGPVNGITYRGRDGGIVENPCREVLDLSSVPFVYRDMEGFRNKIVYYESSRGCPFSCSYCLSSVDKKLRFRDTALVKQELQIFMDAGVPQVKFVDRTFNCSHKHAMDIWTYITEHDNGITNFHFEVAADLLTEEELKLLEKMRPGLIQLEIGIQSTNPRTIEEIRRTMDYERVKHIVRRIQGYGNIHQHLDLIAGLPYEDMDSFGRSFDDVYALHPEQLQLGFLKVLKGSWMERQKEAYGLVHKSKPCYEVLYTDWITYDDILRLKGIEEMVEVYYNSGQYTRTIGSLEEEFGSPFEMYDRIRGYYVEHNHMDVQHKRSARYGILLDFITEWCREKAEYYRDLLTFDYYLRENAKTRPEFAGSYVLTKEEVRQFYEKEEQERHFLIGYEAFDRNQMRKMTHLERFTCLKKTVLFDYMQRNPLNGEARTCMIDM